MDVLNSMLEKQGVDYARMYADDTAAGSKSIEKDMGRMKKAFDQFERLTKLKLNISKTVLLTTIPPKDRGKVRTVMDEIGWKTVRIVEHAVYLGIPFGRPPVAEFGLAYLGRI